MELDLIKNERLYLLNSLYIFFHVQGQISVAGIGVNKRTALYQDHELCLSDFTDFHEDHENIAWHNLIQSYFDAKPSGFDHNFIYEPICYVYHDFKAEIMDDGEKIMKLPINTLLDIFYDKIKQKSSPQKVCLEHISRVYFHCKFIENHMTCEKNYRVIFLILESQAINLIKHKGATMTEITTLTQNSVQRNVFFQNLYWFQCNCLSGEVSILGLGADQRQKDKLIQFESSSIEVFVDSWEERVSNNYLRQKLPNRPIYCNDFNCFDLNSPFIFYKVLLPNNHYASHKQITISKILDILSATWRIPVAMDEIYRIYFHVYVNQSIIILLFFICKKGYETMPPNYNLIF
jgi:hypothetical protein